MLIKWVAVTLSKKAIAKLGYLFFVGLYALKVQCNSHFNYVSACNCNH